MFSNVVVEPAGGVSNSIQTGHMRQKRTQEKHQNIDREREENQRENWPEIYVGVRCKWISG